MHSRLPLCVAVCFCNVASMSVQFQQLHEKSQGDSCRITCCITPLNMGLFPQFCIVPTDRFVATIAH